jgi:hypothetical protein
LIDSFGGVISSGPSSAFVHRSANYHIQFMGYWQSETPSSSDATITNTWLSSFYDQLTPLITNPQRPGHNGAYRNYCDLDLQPTSKWMDYYFGDAAPRLQLIKLNIDPHQRFTSKQAIPLP